MYLRILAVSQDLLGMFFFPVLKSVKEAICIVSCMQKMTKTYDLNRFVVHDMDYFTTLFNVNVATAVRSFFCILHLVCLTT